MRLIRNIEIVNLKANFFLRNFYFNFKNKINFYLSNINKIYLNVT